MRTSLSFRIFTLIAVVAPTALLRAQFQAPTAEELKMTSDPKAPGASAVFLNVEEVTDDKYHFHTFYARIKVLTEKGKELATVEIPYEHGFDKVTDIQARTIHSDGTIIPLKGKPEDILAFKTTMRDHEKLQVGQKVFNLPSVEVGSILEYRYRLLIDEDTYSSPQWEIQRPWFVHHAHYSFLPFKGFLPGADNVTSSHLVDEHGNFADKIIVWTLLPTEVPIKPDMSGRYTIDLNDIPPAPAEEWMPPIQSALYQVRFYYINGASAGNFWNKEGKYWSKDVDHFAEPSKAIQDAVGTLVAAGDPDLDKARKIYKAVQALDNTDYSRKKSSSELKQLKLKEAKRAEDTWAQKGGSSRDLTLLYLAMLRAAGLTAYEMRVVNRDRGVFTANYLNFDQLDDDVVVASIAGKEVALDPGEKMCPFQTVSWIHAGATGVRQNKDGLDVSTLPLQPYTANTLLRVANLTLDAHGAVAGDLRFVMTGQEALRWRQIALEDDLDEAKKQFDHALESIVPAGIEAHIDHFDNIADPDSSLVAIGALHGTLGTATSKRLLLPSVFFGANNGRPFVNEEKRIEPIDMHYAEQGADKVIYHLPDGFTVEGLPQDSKTSWEGHAILAFKTKTEPGQITILHQFSRSFTLAKPDEYNDLRGFYQKVAATDQQQLVLAVSQGTKGNE